MPEDTPNEQPAGEGQPAEPDAGAGGGDSSNDGGADASAPAGEGEPGGATGGGEEGSGESQPEAAEEGGSEVPESSGEATEEKAEGAVTGDGPSVPMASDDPEKRTAVPQPPVAPLAEVEDPTSSSDEQPEAGLPTGDETSEDESAPEETVGEKLEDLKDEGLEKAKEIGRATLKEAIVESRNYVGTLLKSEKLDPDQAKEIKRLYRAAEKHAIAGRVAVSFAMAKRLENYVKTRAIVTRSEKARATDNYLAGLMRLATGAVQTFLGAFGGPLVDSLTDIGLTAVDDFLK